MQSYRISTRIPKPNHLVRVVATTLPKQKMSYYACVPRHSRNMSSFFPRHPFATDFAPLFRLFDEATNELTSPSNAQPLRAFQPRFDVREEKDAFHLTGELPGIAQENIQIEFVDQNTMTIHGRTVRERTSGTPPAAVKASEPQKAIENTNPATPAAESSTERPASPSSPSYHKATVEDEANDEDGYSVVNTPATALAETAKPAEASTATETPAKNEKPKSKYWVSERSVGQFHRTFSFPGHVDQDNVKASLKDGILSVVVPKAVVKEPRRISIE